MIEVENASKRYGTFEAVKGVSFSVGQDQVLGFLGPNGAGKTTIMKMLTGCHFPSNGKVKIDGFSVEEDPVQVKKRIGYLPESNPLYGDLNPVEYLRFAASARLLGREDLEKAVAGALAACGLEDVKTQRIESLSKGYKQRVGLAQAIIHDPPILILDEPTSGLDPNQIIEIRSLIRELGKRKTVILSTHILQEVEAVCSRVLILNEGRITAMGTPEEIAETMKGGDLNTWELELKGAELADVQSRLAQLGMDTGNISVRVIENGIVHLSFEVRSEGYSNAGERIFDWAVSEGYKILGMNRKKLSLEDIFVKLTSEQEQGG
ncbi:MAG: ATP-binding cassette domain-containing protein [Treponema sp.]|jgi:ABC-2 type transport system ATP-binding protein|nr:ATP-binding cassette domain-containing protein [Treponema sp.]